jgi:uncharacterized membrane protein YhiD involved in acid resistance
MDQVVLESLELSKVSSFTYGEILLNLMLAFILGMIISYVYKITHKGLSYSQSFILTIVFVTIIVSMVIMIIENNLARAFALVGALSIIRFRTVVKDTKDTAFIFLGLAAGLACGTSNYFIAISGTLVISAIVFILNITNFGTLYKSEFILRYVTKKTNANDHSKLLDKYTKSSSLLHLEPTGDRDQIRISVDIVLKNDSSAEVLVAELNKVETLSDITLIASKNDVDY